LLTREWVFDKVFERTGRAAAHGSTFSKNDLAMAAGIATLDVIETERLTERAARLGELLMKSLEIIAQNHEVIHEVRGKGLMIAVEFGAPRSLRLQAAWSVLEKTKKGLFSLLVAIPLLREHRILAQAGDRFIKLTPPLVVSEADCQRIVQAFDSVLTDSEQLPSAMWSFGLSLAGNFKRGRDLIASS
jgi:ornithine--oxo-acid transaminase